MSEAKQNYWKDMIEVWKSSGLSRNEFCRQKNLSLHTLVYWQKKFAGGSKKLKPTKFISLSQPAMLELRLAGEVVLKIPASTDPKWLADFLGQLK